MRFWMFVVMRVMQCVVVRMTRGECRLVLVLVRNVYVGMLVRVGRGVAVCVDVRDRLP